jgi:hypothetical protein
MEVQDVSIHISLYRCGVMLRQSEAYLQTSIPSRLRVDDFRRIRLSSLVPDYVHIQGSAPFLA